MASPDPAFIHFIPDFNLVQLRNSSIFDSGSGFYLASPGSGLDLIHF